MQFHTYHNWVYDVWQSFATERRTGIGIFWSFYNYLKMKLEKTKYILKITLTIAKEKLLAPNYEVCDRQELRNLT